MNTNKKKYSALIIFLLFISFNICADDGDIVIEKLPRFDAYSYHVQFELSSVSLDQLEGLLSNEVYLEHIPYYSIYNEETSILFDSVDFSGDSLRVTMLPFESFTGEIKKSRISDQLQWSYTNSEVIKYGWFPVLGKGDMKISFSAVAHDGLIYINGWPELEVFPLLKLLGKRLEWAVEGRILAVFYALADFSPEYLFTSNYRNSP